MPKQIRHRMAIPIPDDWDNETWFSVCVEWPDSIQWRSLFWMSVNRFSRGRTWDEKTGTVTDAQAIGKEIYYRALVAGEGCTGDPDEIKLEYLNWLLDCLGLEQVETLPENCGQVAQIFDKCDGGCSEDGDCMANVTNLRCTDDGYLEMERCCQWIRVCYIGNITGLPEPDNAGFEQDYKCNFAGAYARHMVRYKLLAIAGTIEANLLGATDQEIVDIVKGNYAEMMLNSADLFLTIRYYRLDDETVTSEIDELTDANLEETIRCLLYNAIKEYPDNDPIYAVSPEEVAVFITMVSTYSSLSPITRNVVRFLLRAFNFQYVRSSLGNYTELAFDCTCDSGELSPQSEPHGMYQWILDAGRAGGVQNSTHENTWPLVQWCVTNTFTDEIGDYGFAFDLIATSAPALIIFNNEQILEQQCTNEDYDISPDSQHSGTPLQPGKYIVCHATMYTNLENDATEYTLLENSGYNITPHSPEHGWDTVGKLSFRSSVSGQQYYAHATNFRFIRCLDDV